MLIADLHIHSKYSRATSRDCVPEYLDLWARRKGIGLLGTGDLTHPAWRQQLQDCLIPAEDGFYSLRPELRLPGIGAAEAEPRFVLSGEISCIYKKNGRTRKVHNLILLPSLEAAELLSQRLEAIGNIHSDGRPILGLDSRDLLEITLDTCADAIFIPAHIWTPHFSLFGAFSGFDTIEECFEDLTPYIHALETGLSSDPPMNRRLSALDRYHLVSSSDAHSPAKLGREANLLEIPLSFFALSRALEEGPAAGLTGTIEFFPEEGKYHYDGHRACGVCLSPSEAEQYGGICPVCGRKLTTGVQHRVEQLADRPEHNPVSESSRFESLVPLPEVIGASIGAAASSKRAEALYESMLETLGPEFSILREVPLEEIGRAAGPCVQEGIRRVREGQVERTPGYDGEYGIIHLLSAEDRERLNGQTCLFSPGIPRAAARSVRPAGLAPVEQPAIAAPALRADTAAPASNPEQEAAITAEEPAVAVIAGPGTGKTRTLISRAEWLISRQGIPASRITAVTFTNRAAAEIRERLCRALGTRQASALTTGTFHSLCYAQLRRQYPDTVLADESQLLELAGQTLREFSLPLSPRQLLTEVSERKNGILRECHTEACDAYEAKLRQAGLLYYDDLLLQTLALWESGTVRAPHSLEHLLVDEFQDINPIQYRLIRAWAAAGKSLFVIGDPDQAIYGFRGSDSHCFARLAADFPTLRTLTLTRNYRCTPEILACALPLICAQDGIPRTLQAQAPHGPRVRLCTADSDLSQAIFAAHEINRMVGGLDMADTQSFGSRRADAPLRAFSDIALLYRTHRQADLLEKCLRREGIPYLVTGRDDFLSADPVRGCIGFFRFLLDPHDLPALADCLRLIWNCPEDLIRHFSAQLAAADYPALSCELISSPSFPCRQDAPLQEWFRLTEHFLPRIPGERPRRLLEDWAAQARLSPSPSLEQLWNAAVFHHSLADFLDTLRLGADADLLRCGSPAYTTGAVHLLTLHAAKGLEFPVVFLCGVQQGVIPLESASHPSDPAEERRLLFVGMTRAREELLLLTAGTPSPFLADLPASLLDTSRVDPDRLAQGRQLSLF